LLTYENIRHFENERDMPENLKLNNTSVFLDEIPNRSTRNIE